tara:strand:- start:5253 stop:5468 length:216 start_codon:yes stop_codon:yes gene_type:complete
MKGPSIIKGFLDTPFDVLSKFSILIKHSSDFIEETSQLYFPSFSVIAIKSQLIPLSGDIKIFTLSSSLILL